MWEEGATTPLVQLHCRCYILVPEVSPCRWAVCEPAESASGPQFFFFPCGSVMRAQKTESTEADDAHAAPCVCPQGWAQAAQPIGGKGVCEQRVGGAGWQESAPPPQIKKNKISSCLTRWHFGSTLLSRLYSFPPSPPFPFCMPKPLIW